MRLLAILALVLATAVAACGGDEAASTAPPASWDGVHFPYPENGVLPVDDFRAYAESVDADWKRDPAALAREFVGKDGTVSIDGNEVTLLRDGLEDDSVRAERFVLELDEDGDVWSLVSARWEQRCQAGRGHQQFGPELCV